MLVGLLAFSFVFVACDDDEDKTASEKLVGTWKTTNEYTKVGPAPEVETTDSIDACTFDDLNTFESDNTYEFDEGATKCDDQDPQTIATGSWSFIEGDTKLVLDSDSSTSNDTINIVSLSDSRIETSNSYDFGGVTTTIRTVGQKQ